MIAVHGDLALISPVSGRRLLHVFIGGCSFRQRSLREILFITRQHDRPQRGNSGQLGSGFLPAARRHCQNLRGRVGRRSGSAATGGVRSDGLPNWGMAGILFGSA